MKVYVAVSDCGLNGPHVHGVFSEPPDHEALYKFITEFNDWPNGYRGVVVGTTGYQATEIIEFELDGPLQ